MIKANELRIGNSVKSGERFFNATWHTIHQIEEMGFTVEPIGLTPEILLKCGFRFVNHTFYTKDNIVSFASFDNSLSTTYVCGDNEINQVKYLHQLQNLYYSLTGEELGVVW